MGRCGDEEGWAGVMDVQVWHDEMVRWEATGHLDQGPCWCEDCLKDELSGEDGGITGE